MRPPFEIYRKRSRNRSARLGRFLASHHTLLAVIALVAFFATAAAVLDTLFQHEAPMESYTSEEIIAP